MELRIGLAGLGVHGQRYARHLLAGDVPGARLAAVSRADAGAGREFAERHGVAFVERAEDLAEAPGLDAVVLALPPAAHGAVAERCARAGRPVLVEKPLAAGAAAARRVARAVEETGTFLMVAHTLRFDPVVLRLKQECASLGELRSISINQRFEPSDRSWIDTPGCGGMLLNTGIHEFDLLRFITGAEPVSVQARTACGVTVCTEDQFVATLELSPGGLLAVVEASRATRSRSGRIEIVGAEAQLWGDHIHRTLCRVRGRDIEDLGPVPSANTVPLVLRAFVDCLSEGRPPEIGVADGLAAVETVEAALISAREGRPVGLEEIRAAV